MMENKQGQAGSFQPSMCHLTRSGMTDTQRVLQSYGNTFENNQGQAGSFQQSICQVS